MAFVNYNNKEITVKIVYYGPALSGKTTCLKYIYTNKEFQKKGKLITLDTDGDRTLFFDFLPIEIGKLGDYSIKMQLYTVPGQVSYNATRKLVLQGADGVVFVADSQVVIQEQNIESFDNLKENLEANNISYTEIPIIFQYNKRDLKETLPIDILNRDLNPENKPFFPTIATNGENIHEALHTIMKMVIIYLKNKLSVFQKDKTVMFSREEVTATSNPNENLKIKLESDEPETEVFPEDTESEELFELSSPVKDEGAAAHRSDEEEIFNLDDNNILLDQSVSDENIAQVELKELSVESTKKKGKDSVAKLKDESGKSKKEKSEEEEEAKSFNIPLEIEVPKDKTEIKLNLNLRITLRKK